jgi:hypothetical protein
MTEIPAPTPIGRRWYFVDEAGDPYLFNRRGEMVAGKAGCSTFFILGLLDVRDLPSLRADLVALRGRLLADHYLKGIRSMQAAVKKTALLFHAKDDVPEVRQEVFKILMVHDLRFYAAIRDKRAVANYVRQRNEQEPAYRYGQNELYDLLVRRLFRRRLHQNEAYQVLFARRGFSDRTEALEQALTGARRDFEVEGGTKSNAPIVIRTIPASQEPALQAADYFLWALQRLYERNESRYWEFVWPKVRCVMDVDDTTRFEEGEVYSEANPLTGTLRKK